MKVMKVMKVIRAMKVLRVMTGTKLMWIVHPNALVGHTPTR